MKKAKGITLISLIITIIVLIILAGVAINFAMGENGVIKQAKNAKEIYTNESEKEKSELNDMYSNIEFLESNKIVIAISNNVSITRGNEQKVSEYFKIKKLEEIESIKYFNITEGNKEIENTKDLLAGNYVIECIVTKKDKTEESAKIELTVENIVYIMGTTNVDEFLDEELTIIGNSEDATIITDNTYYFLPENNITFENVIIDVNAISINSKNIDVKFKNCKLNLTGYNSSNIKAGIICNSSASNSRLYFENCIFQTENAKKFDSWATSTNMIAYIKSDCTPNDISSFTTYVTSTGRNAWQLVTY